ncbi:MAG: PAS domain-containing protein [Chloroflexi bacterium]|nr:PAS domain-containing protein [Chloroflexota bacterium]
MIRASLKTKLALALVGLFLPVLALLVVDFQITYQSRVESVLDGEITSASFLASLVDFSFEQSTALAQAFAGTPSIQSLNAERIYPALVAETKAFPQYDDVAVVDARGQGIVSLRNPPGSPTVNVAARDYFQRAMATNRPVMSNMLTSWATGNPIVVAAAPIPGPDGRPIGVVITAISPQYLAQRIAAAPLAPDQRVIITDPTGVNAIAIGEQGMSLQGLEMSAHPPVISAMQGRPFRDVVISPITRDERATVAVSTPEHRWVVVVSTPTSIIWSANIGPILMRLAIYLGIMIVAGLAILLMARRAVLAPLSSLVHALSAFGHDQLQQRIEIKTGDELETVAQAFNTMAEEILLREQRLRESEERYRTLAEAAEDVIFLIDRDDRIRYVNSYAARQYGLQPDEMIGKRREEFFALDTSRRQKLNLRKVLETGEPIYVEAKTQYPGREVWLGTQLVPVSNEEGEVNAVLGVARDISERKRIEQFREEYVAIISHDLRNPLAIIHGEAQLVERFADKPEIVRNSANAIIVSARHMNLMIQDLVDSARLEAGQLRLEKQPVNLRAFTAELLERSRALVDVKRLQLEIAPDLPAASADPDRLERIFTNLLTNALKYSPADKDVLVKARETASEVTVSVADRGVGIAPEDLPRIFERFYRAKEAARSDGLGLGLYITEMLVGAHGGRIWVESEVGRGSTFHFTLPIAHPGYS